MVSAVILALGMFLLPYPLALPAGLLILLLVASTYTVFNKNEGSRARWILVTIFLAHLTLMAIPLYLFLWSNDRLPEEYGQTLMLRAGILGGAGIVSLVLTAIFALVSVYISSVYLLSLHTAEEDISVYEAMRSFVAVLLNTSYDWMIISEGQIKTTRPGGVMKQLGGPGKLIIEPGNAVVLQSGGRVTRVCGAGIVSTKRFENIKEVVNLRNQFAVVPVENVITADKIPLTITMGVGYRIKPADDSNAQDVIKDSEGLFAVNRKIILNAVYENTADGKWTGLGKGAPAAQLRDQVMALTLDEIFPEGVTTPDMRKIKQIEDKILANLNGFASSKGIWFTGVDIQQVIMPERVKEAIEMKVRADAEAKAIEGIEGARGKAFGEMLQYILLPFFQNQVDSKAALKLVEIFVNQNKHILTDDILRHQYLGVLEKMAQSEGTKIFSSNGAQPTIESPISSK